MLSRAVARILVASMMLLGPASAAADTGIVQKSYLPVQDTYVEYYDLAVHGFEPTIRVGIEPRECFSNGWNPCDDDGKECCDVLETYNYCAVPGQ